MIFLADSTGINRLPTDEDLNATELAQYDADQQAVWFITLALPNSIYMNMDFQAVKCGNILKLCIVQKNFITSE